MVIRHSYLRSIFTEFWHLSVCVEVGRGLLGVNSNSHPADVLVDGWERAKPAAFDVTVTSPLTPATSGDQQDCSLHSRVSKECFGDLWLVNLNNNQNYNNTI